MNGRRRGHERPLIVRLRPPVAVTTESVTSSRVPVLVQVLLAGGLLLLLFGSLVASPTGEIADPHPRAIIGNKEYVRITGPTGKTVEALARVDTGASSSSMDRAIAEELDFDLDDADTVTIASSLGRDERPVVPAAMQLAGDAFATRINVADRSERSTPVLLGRADLNRFRISVGDELLTTPGSPEAPSALGSLLAQSAALGPRSLLAVLPLAALIIVVLRVVFGLQTLGTFSPVLLAIGYSQAGLVPGVLLTLGMFVLGFAVQPVLRRFRLPRVVRLSALIGSVSIALVSLQEFGIQGGAVDSWGASLPVVVTAVIIERLWETWDLDGAGSAARDACLTLAVATVVAVVMLTPLVRVLADTVPVQFAVTCTVWACIVGTYRGLRVNELMRFRDADAAAAVSMRVPA